MAVDEKLDILYVRHNQLDFKGVTYVGINASMKPPYMNGSFSCDDCEEIPSRITSDKFFSVLSVEDFQEKYNPIYLEK